MSKLVEVESQSLQCAARRCVHFQFELAPFIEGYARSFCGGMASSSEAVRIAEVRCCATTSKRFSLAVRCSKRGALRPAKESHSRMSGWVCRLSGSNI